MSKRGGLGQRGIDLLISVSPGIKESQNEQLSENVKTSAPADADKKAAGAGKNTGRGSAASPGNTAKTNSSSRKKPGAKKSSASAGDSVSDSTEIKIDLIEPNRSQPRRTFNEDSLNELADSIKQYGVIEPLIVQKKDDYYEIIAGERRWRAAKIAGLKTVPVVVKDYTPREVMEISLIENIQREDLNPIEEANAYRRLMDDYNLKQDEVAERVSRSRAAIANAVRLLNLDERVQDMVVNDMITTGHARALLAISDPELQYSTAQRVFDEKMSVRDVEKLVKRLNNDRPEPTRKTLSDTLQAVYDTMTEKMKTSLGTKVSIHPRSPQKGKIEIEYYSADELDRIYAVLLGSDMERGGNAGAEFISE